MRKILFFSILLTSMACKKENQTSVLYQSDAFTVFTDKVIQHDNRAEVVNRKHLTSNYKSPASATFPRLVEFKFSINTKDNELPSGKNHWVVLEEPEGSEVFVFGEQPEALPQPPQEFLPTNFKYTIKVDVSSVLQDFKEKGYFEAHDGTRIAASDFKGFYIAGNAEPLSWDFVNLDNKGLKLEPTQDSTIYSITLTFNPYDASVSSEKEWKLSENISQKPQYTSNQPIVDALYNLSLEEALLNIEPDSTLRTGAKWGGVWTRDVSYSTLLAFAYHEPEVAKISLRKKVRRGRIIQDTGSGGAWPVSSDRTTWVLAAWEIYKVTGDKDWLDEMYPIIKNTLDDDFKTIYDPETGLYSGESSFLDWREQTYPKWMDNADIYVSQNLGTNVVHFQAHKILAEICRLKNITPQPYDGRADSLRAAINTQLWNQEKGFYNQYLYGRNQLIPSPRFEALGEALAILFDVADTERAQQILANSPVTDYGVTCIYPQIPGIPPYHNNGIWPFVQAYWNWAAAKSGNEAVLNHGLASIYRAGALFLTNYENMVAETGDFEGTEINSHRMLWSMAGNLAMVHRVFMGVRFELDGLRLEPVIPRAYSGTKTLKNFKYRNALLNITIDGFGNKIASIKINGKAVKDAFIPAEASGTFDIEITMTNSSFRDKRIHLVPNRFSPITVQARLDSQKLVWDSIPEIATYRIYQNGELLKEQAATLLELPDTAYGCFQVTAIDANGFEGFSSEPIIVAEDTYQFELESQHRASAKPYTNYSGNGFVEASLQKNTSIPVTFKVAKAGKYSLAVRYSNGNGRWNTDNKCAIRSLTVNGAYAGVLVFPQRGQDEWSDWGFSNNRIVYLQEGENRIKIHFEDWNNNMNVDENTAMLDYIRLLRVE